MIDGRCRVLPVLIDCIEPPPELSGLLYADCSKGKRGGLKLILKTAKFESTRYPNYYETLFGPNSATGRLQAAESAVTKVFGSFASSSWQASAIRFITYRSVTVNDAAMDSAGDRIDMEIALDTVSGDGSLWERNELNAEDWRDFERKIHDEYGQRFGLLLTQKAAGHELRSRLTEICSGVLGRQSENDDGECEIAILADIHDNPDEDLLRQRLTSAKEYFRCSMEHARRLRAGRSRALLRLRKFIEERVARLVGNRGTSDCFCGVSQGVLRPECPTALK